MDNGCLAQLGTLIMAVGLLGLIVTVLAFSPTGIFVNLFIMGVGHVVRKA